MLNQTPQLGAVENLMRSAGRDEEHIDKIKGLATEYANRNTMAGNMPAYTPNQSDGPMSSVATTTPGKFAITQRFGNYNPALYRGVTEDMRNRGTDFGVPSNTPLQLPQGQWEVIEAFGDVAPGTRGMINKGYGNSVLVRNRQTGEMMRYSHLNKVGVKPGQILSGGSMIGLSGDTGNATGAHLDLEYYDPKGALADVMQSQYANILFGG